MDEVPVEPECDLKSIRAARPDGAPIYVIMDDLSANKTPAIRTTSPGVTPTAATPTFLAAQCRRARIRSERQQRWGGPRPKVA